MDSGRVRLGPSMVTNTNLPSVTIIHSPEPARVDRTLVLKMINSSREWYGRKFVGLVTFFFLTSSIIIVALDYLLSSAKQQKLIIEDKFMKLRILGLCLLGITLLSGCVGTPQSPVALDRAFWQQPSKRVGLIVSEVPAPDVYLPGASCLLCIAAAEMANSSLSSHTETLSVDDVKSIGTDVEKLFQSRDIQIVEIAEKLNLSKLPKYKSEVPNTAKRDFSLFAEKYNISHLLVLNLNAVGMQRGYSSYIPTSDPKGYFNALSYLVDLSDNTYKWYRPVNITKAVTDEWDEPPTFPALTNAYYQAIAEGKEIIISSLDEQQATQ